MKHSVRQKFRSRALSLNAMRCISVIVIGVADSYTRASCPPKPSAFCVHLSPLVSRTQNTYAQYIAAKELKRLGWRYHTGYMMWFQRFREPITLTDTYEESDMIFYDYVRDDQNAHTHIYIY